MCFHCEEKYTTDHSCKNQKALRLEIVPEGFSNSDFSQEIEEKIVKDTDITINSMAGVVRLILSGWWVKLEGTKILI